VHTNDKIIIAPVVCSVIVEKEVKVDDIINVVYADARTETSESYCQTPAPTNQSDFEHLVTEDDEAVDNTFSEKQQRLLTTSLYNSWPGPGKGCPFLTMANVGLFYAVNEEPLVPDVLVSCNVLMHDDVWAPTKRPYFVSQYGKPPEIVIEIVSNTKGNEDTTKMPKYAKAKVRYYIIFDPLEQLKQGLLRVYELRWSTYVEKSDLWLGKVGLGLTFWEGWFEDSHEVWLRWCDKKGQLILTGTETTELAEKQVKKEQQEKEAAQKWAEREQREKEAAQKRAKQEQREKEAVQKRVKQEQREKEAAQKRAKQEQREKEAAQKRAEQEQREKEAVQKRAEQAEKRAEQTEKRAEQTEKRAEQTEKRAEQTEKQNERLVAQLRALGIEPDAL
jgi:Uma2 family endonuclease